MTNPTTDTLTHLDRRLAEAFHELWDNFVDPREPFHDDGTRWIAAGTATGGGQSCLSEVQLRDLRQECRALAQSNEFAINGHENRISYLVGPGHTYRATMRKGATAAAELPGQVQSLLDEFLRTSRWQRRQQEIVRRWDRDGEVFLRFFVAGDGMTQVRFVEPDQVATPPHLASDSSASLGVQTEPDDVEEVVAYWIDGAAVPAGEIQHRKGQVDANVKRGLPLFFPVRKNLRRAEKLLRNMSVVAEIQSAIALIRKHRSGVKSGVQQFVAAAADATIAASSTGKSLSVQRFGPGTILDAHGGMEYDFPAAGLDAGTYVTVLQAELRAIASRLVMPEFMLTSDASNANYASTMVAEGPAMRMFARLQAELVSDDLAVMWRVVTGAVHAGRLPPESLTAVEIQAVPPSLSTRDLHRESQVFAIEHERGILSPQTWSQLRGLDYDQEQENLRRHLATQEE